MKIRTDFVTNSSSSSYLIAYKHSNVFDEETLNKYPFLKVLPNIIDSILNMEVGYETNKARIFMTKEEYEEYIVKSYSWSKATTLEDIIEDDSYVRNIYQQAMAYFDKGYIIADKRIDYHDEGLVKIIEAIAKDNEDFIIMERDG